MNRRAGVSNDLLTASWTSYRQPECAIRHLVQWHIGKTGGVFCILGRTPLLFASKICCASHLKYCRRVIILASNISLLTIEISPIIVSPGKHLQNRWLSHGSSATDIDNLPLISVNWQRCQQGELVERLKAPVLKTGEGASPPWVQIPHSPPHSAESPMIRGFFFVILKWYYYFISAFRVFDYPRSSLHMSLESLLRDVKTYKNI